jgi:hypothetical protein
MTIIFLKGKRSGCSPRRWGGIFPKLSKIGKTAGMPLLPPAANLNNI